MESIGIILLFGTFFLGLVVFYVFLQYLKVVRDVESHQVETNRQLSDILDRIDALSARSGGGEIEKSGV